MSESQYAPGTYVKGDDVREAVTARDAVSLVFEGFKPKAVEPSPAIEAVEALDSLKALDEVVEINWDLPPSAIEIAPTPKTLNRPKKDDK